MALSTYNELLTTALDVIGRDGDASMTAYAPVAVALVEAKLNRNLRVAEMEASTALTGTAGSYTLPADFAAWRSVSMAPYGSLEFVTPDWALSAYPSGEGGVPQFFTVEGATLKTYPASSSSLTLGYYQKLPALSVSAPSNWLLSNHRDIYLFLLLSELNAYAKDGETALLWNQRGMQAVEELNVADRAKRYSNTSIRTKGPTP